MADVLEVTVVAPPSALNISNPTASSAVSVELSMVVAAFVTTVELNGHSRNPNALTVPCEPVVPLPLVVLPVTFADVKVNCTLSATISYFPPCPVPVGVSANANEIVATKSGLDGTTAPLYIKVLESSLFSWDTVVTHGLCPPPGNTVTLTDVRSAQSWKSEHPGVRRLISYCPEADTYGIHVKLGPLAAAVPTSTDATRTVWTVAAMFVFATFSVQLPVRVALEGLGAKHDCPFWLSTEEAKAPDERSWRICRPAEVPFHCESLIITPVKLVGLLNKKSWYGTAGLVPRGQGSVQVMFWPETGST